MFRQDDAIDRFNSHLQLGHFGVSYAIGKIRGGSRPVRIMPSRSLFRLVHLPPDLAAQLRESVDEAFQSLGGATADLILHYARQRHHVNMKDLPRGIDELDKALKEMLGSGRRLVANQCAEILSRRLGKDIRARTDKLSDVFRQVIKVYARSRPSKPEEEVGSLLGDFENQEESLLSGTEVE